MSKVLRDLGDKFFKVFVDDFNIHSESWEEHLQHLDVVFFMFWEVNLKLNPNKCCFVAKSITFLGHVVNKDGTKPYLGKIEVILHFPELKTITNIRYFLGITGYYWNYVRSYSRLTILLFELIKIDVDLYGIWALNKHFRC